MVLKNLIDFRFNQGEGKYIIAFSFGVRWVKDTKDNQTCFKKQQIKDAVAYLFFNCYSTIDHKNFCQIISILMGPDTVLFFANLFLYFYESKSMNALKENNLITTRKLKPVLQ